MEQKKCWTEKLFTSAENHECVFAFVLHVRDFKVFLKSHITQYFSYHRWDTSNVYNVVYL